MNSESTDLVSVVISCYNHEHYINEAIESVLAQTYPSFEIIVVDDGSTDKSWDVARSFSEVQCVRQRNAGTPAATRNRGLQESRGDYVVFLDGDDRLLPDALEIGLRHLREHPDCAFAAGRCQAMNNEQKCLTIQPPTTESDHYRALLERNYILTPGSVMFRRDMVNELNGFNASPAIKGSDDYDMYLRVASRWPVCYHEGMVLEYRRHENNLSKNPERMLVSSLTVLRAQHDCVKQNPSHKEACAKGIAFWQEFYGQKVFDKVRNNVRERAWKQAVKGIEVLVQYCPQILVSRVIRKTYRVLLMK
jgi:glycosyltransferase involved in cell wall biosynthesis